MPLVNQPIVLNPNLVDQLTGQKLLTAYLETEEREYDSGGVYDDDVLILEFETATLRLNISDAREIEAVINVESDAQPDQVALDLAGATDHS